jgi:NADH:ubiquinone reductase (H+-translocating)
MSQCRRVIIVGGGFGGLRAAQALNSELVDVSVIDRRNYRLFQPLLYQIATGSLGRGQISASLRSVLGTLKDRAALCAWHHKIHFLELILGGRQHAS